MRSLKSLLLAALVFCAFVFAEEVAETEDLDAAEAAAANENGEAILISRRVFVNDTFVVGMPFHIRVDIWNIGTKDATNVVLTENFPTEYFNSVDSHTWDKIPANGNATYEYQVTALKDGTPQVPAPKLTFEGKTAMIDTVRPAYIESKDAYEKRIDKHIPQWIIVAVASLLTAGIPSFLSYRLYKEN